MNVILLFLFLCMYVNSSCNLKVKLTSLLVLNIWRFSFELLQKDLFVCVFERGWLCVLYVFLCLIKVDWGPSGLISTMARTVIYQNIILASIHFKFGWRPVLKRDDIHLKNPDVSLRRALYRGHGDISVKYSNTFSASFNTLCKIKELIFQILLKCLNVNIFTVIV